MAWILDLEKALRKGFEIPTGGTFRGERAQIVRETADDKVTVILPNSLRPAEEYTVSRDCLISDGEDD